MKQFQTLTKFIIVETSTQEPLFGDRLFDQVGHAKNAFNQEFKRFVYKNDELFRKRFDEQDKYSILELTFKLESVELKSVGEKNSRRYLKF